MTLQQIKEAAEKMYPMESTGKWDDLIGESSSIAYEDYKASVEAVRSAYIAGATCVKDQQQPSADDLLLTMYNGLRSIIRQIPNDQGLADWDFGFAEIAEQQAIEYFKSKGIDTTFNYTFPTPLRQQQPSAGVWVKASDRMPGLRVDVVIKYGDNELLIGGRSLVQDIVDNGYTNVVWLDTSASTVGVGSQSVRVEKSAEEILASYGTYDSEAGAHMPKIAKHAIISAMKEYAQQYQSTGMGWNKNMDVYIKAWLLRLMKESGLGTPSATFPETPVAKFYDLINNTWGDERKKWVKSKITLPTNDSDTQTQGKSEWVSVEDGLPMYEEEGKKKTIRSFITNGKRVWKAYFYPKQFKECEWEDIDDVDIEKYCDEINGTYWLKEGWYETYEHRGEYFESIVLGITHWMKIPSLPSPPLNK